MRPGGGSNKGSGFERDVCRLLSLWVTHGDRNSVFWRSAGSGSMATRAKAGHSVREVQSGDIAAVDGDGHFLIKAFYIECKFYKSLDLLLFMFKRRGTFARFWAKTKKLALKEGRLPMLICKQNRSGLMLCVEDPGVGQLVSMKLIEMKLPQPFGGPGTNVSPNAPIRMHGIHFYNLEALAK